ncbi:lamin tail domain-containing protein [Candidatus Latescibacterota bacterium]
MVKLNKKTSSQAIICIAAVITVILIAPAFSLSQTIVISEIMFNPDGNENAREYVEILNLTEDDMSLEGFSIGDGEGFDTIIPAPDEDYIVPAGSYALIIDPDYFTAGEEYTLIPPGTPLFTVDDSAIGNRGLSNSTAETVSLISDSGDTLSAVSYSLDCAAGYSWEKILPGGSETIDNFKQSLVRDGTPGRENSASHPPTPVPPGTIVINEVMAAPADGNAEWIELYNTSESSVDLFVWKISDSSVETGGIIEEHVFIGPKGYAVISGTLLDSSNAPDILDESTVIVVDNFPALNNDGDIIRLFDYGNEPADSMSYEDVSQGLSFERISTVGSGASKRWDVCVDPLGSTPGALNSIDNSAITENNGDQTDTIELTVSPNPFSDRTTISYTLSFPLSRVNMYVYDRRGRLITKLRDAEESGSSWTGEWDGRANGENLPAGPYILNIEALDKNTGTVHNERKTIVIGRNL